MTNCAQNDRWRLDPNHRSLFLDRFQRIELPVATAGAGFLGGFPGVGGPNVRIPEGPGAALAGALFVDGTPAGFAVEEDAVVVPLLFERAADANLIDELLLERLGRHLDAGG